MPQHVPHALFPHLHDKMPSTIHRVAVLPMFCAKRPFFSIRDDREVLGNHPQLDEVVPNGFRPLLSQHQVIRGGASFVTMSFDLQLNMRI